MIFLRLFPPVGVLLFVTLPTGRQAKSSQKVLGAAKSFVAFLF